MGLSIDWSREFATCDVDYYKQQQMLFLDFLGKGSDLSQAIPRSTGTRST
jgi:leucyl-tRNA synthetase